MKTYRKIKIKSDIVHSKRKNDILLTSVREGEDEVFKIEGISIVFLEMILANNTFEEISLFVNKNYDIDKTIIEKDLNAFMEDLIFKKIAEE